LSAYIDTSALAKCYIREPRSLDVLDWASAQREVATASLALLEFRCLLARRRRAGNIGAELERRALAEFDGHVRGGAWRMLQGSLGDIAAARDLIDALPAIPLRALDALHLAAARGAGAQEFATSDGRQADAARALGFAVHDFS
jgi:predicted nucleic acid-binding protein